MSNGETAATTRKLEIEVSVETETILRHLSETSGGSVASLAAAAIETGIHEVARVLREDTAELVGLLNNAKTIVINDRNLTLQWHLPGGPECGWMDLQNQTPEDLRRWREPLDSKSRPRHRRVRHSDLAALREPCRPRTDDHRGRRAALPAHARGRVHGAAAPRDRHRAGRTDGTYRIDPIAAPPTRRLSSRWPT